MTVVVSLTAVVLRRDRGMALADLSVATPVVRAALTVRGRAYDPSAGRWVGRADVAWYSEATRAGPTLAPTLGLADTGVTAFPAGLLPRVRAALEAAGHAVRVTSDLYWSPPRPALDLAAIQRLPPDLRAAAVAVWIGGPRLAHLPPGLRLIRAVRRILTAVPTARAVITAPSRPEVRYWIDRLTGRVGRPVYDHITQSGNWGPAPRVTVLCDDTARHCESGDFDLVVVPDAGRLLRSAARFEPVEEHGIPAVGLLAAGTTLGDFEQLRAEALFGGVVPPAMPSSAVTVCVLPVAAPSPVRVGGCRERVWGHRDRTRLVASTAVAYRRRDRRALAGLGLHAPRRASAPRVAVLVEAPDHARRLAAELPGWAVCTGRCVDADPAPPTAVVTDGWRSARPAARFDVVIDARAADPVLPVGTILAAGPGSVLVDVRDSWDGALALRADARLAAYGGEWLRVV